MMPKKAKNGGARGLKIPGYIHKLIQWPAKIMELEELTMSMPMPEQPRAPKPRVSISNGKPPAKPKPSKPDRTGGFQTRDRWTGIYRNRFGYNAEVTPHNYAHLDHFNTGVQPPKAPKAPKMGK